MTVSEYNADNMTPPEKLEKGLKQVLRINWETIAWGILFVLAIASRFWDLGVRAMSHDESLHTYFSYNLAMGRGFAHTPMMHGPLLFHVTALNYLLFGDNEFSSRIYPAVLGVIIVLFPLLLRRWLGRKGAVAAGGLFLISPYILYYSRYIRHDIPAIFGALLLMLGLWCYVEKRQFRYLLLLVFGQAFMFVSKEVAFIYVAIIGLFLIMFFLSRALRAHWRSENLKTAVTILLALVFILAAAFGVLKILQSEEAALAEQALSADQPVDALPPVAIPPVDQEGAEVAAMASPVASQPWWVYVFMAAIALSAIAIVVLMIMGLGPNLRRFPELDGAMVMGTFILPHLAPFVIMLLGHNPSSEMPADLQFTAIVTAVMLLISAIIGTMYFLPRFSRRTELVLMDDGDEVEIELPLSFTDILSGIVTSRWLPLAALYWGFTLFFFTTMFTNGNGLGTGVIGSLSYWLEQHDVERGGQPWFYYLLVQVPMYEFLPALLTISAGIGALFAGIRRFVSGAPNSTETDGDDVAIPAPDSLDLDAPVIFPVLPMLGFLAVMNLVAYSWAGEKMPWLTTHLTMPMILIGGAVIGRMIDAFDWKRILGGNRWIAVLLLPLAWLSFLRVIGPTCPVMPANPLCNTIIPASYQGAIFTGYEIQTLSTTGVWLGAVVFLVASIAGMILLGAGIRARDWWRVVGFFLLGWLVVLTMRASYRAAFITYDDATEFLVYAHSSDTTRDVLEDIEDLSLRISASDGFKIAYDDKVSWPMSWYMREYPTAVYFGSEPTRQLLENATIILSGWGNNSKVESLIGDRYYRFTYIRMWWPLEDYRTTTFQTFRDIARDPALQRGLWEIFTRRSYTKYADAVTPYRNGIRPDYSLGNWPVSDRIYVYIRKDAFAQVWQYGVTASEVAETLDPYAANWLELVPSATFGQSLLARPHGIAIAPDGSLAVADSQNHRIAIFDEAGILVREVGSYADIAEPAGLNEPWDVTMDSEGNLYVANTWNFRVNVFSPQGLFLRTWGHEGPNQVTDSYAFWGPRGITSDAEDRIYVSDTGNKRVLVFSGDGEFIRQIGIGGSFDGQLDEPAGLAIGPDGNLYIADTWNQRVSVFSPDGIFQRSWPVEAWYGSSNERPYIAVDPSGRVFISDPGGFRVIAYSAEGEYLFSFGDYGSMQSPAGLAFNEMGDLFIADTELGIVFRYDHNLFPAPLVGINNAGDLSGEDNTDITEPESADSGSGILPTEINNIPRVDEEDKEKDEEGS